MQYVLDAVDIDDMKANKFEHVFIYVDMNMGAQRGQIEPSPLSNNSTGSLVKTLSIAWSTMTPRG